MTNVRESIDALDRSTFDGVIAWIERGSTVALVGSSGVGKSTLLNTLAETKIAARARFVRTIKRGVIQPVIVRCIDFRAVDW